MKKFALILAAVAAIAPFAAKAEVFVWQDPVYDTQVAFPDNWMRQAQDNDERLFILAPQGADHAACRLYTSHDGRFMDAPAYAGAQVSAFVFNGDAIAREFYASRADSDLVQLTGYTPNGSLGSGAAVMAELNFQKNWMGRTYPMHALVVATQYHGDHIMMSCESLASAWPQWEATMKGIFKSVSFPTAFAPEPNGLYRRFQDDGGVYLPLNRRKDGVTIR